MDFGGMKKEPMLKSTIQEECLHKHAAFRLPPYHILRSARCFAAQFLLSDRPSQIARRSQAQLFKHDRANKILAGLRRVADRQ